MLKSIITFLLLGTSILSHGLSRAQFLYNVNHQISTRVQKKEVIDENIYLTSTYSSKSISHIDDTTEEIAIKGYSNPRINLNIIKTDTRNSINYHFQMTFTTNCEVNKQLEIGIVTDGYDSLSTYSLAMDSISKKIANGFLNISATHFIDLHSDSSKKKIVIRNPFQSSFILSGGTLRYSLIDTITPFAAYEYETMEGPAISSYFTPNDTINYEIEFPKSNISIIPLVVGEQPNGLLSSITLFWDELPNSHNVGTWDYMRTEDYKKLPYDHYLIKLLNNHPKMKMGYLLSLDLSMSRPYTQFQNWQVNSSLILADSIENKSGTWCTSIIAKDSGTYKLYQKIAVNRNSNYTLSYWIRVDNIKSSKGAYGEVYFNDTDFVQASKVNSITGWVNKTLTFNTLSSDTVTIYLRLEKGSGIVFFDEVSLFDSLGNNLIKNGGFEDNNKAIVYTDKNRIWAEAETPANFANTPDSFKVFLQSVENNTMRYGWEDRMALGLHALLTYHRLHGRKSRW